MYTRSRGRLECWCGSASRPSKLPDAGETGVEVGQRETGPVRFRWTVVNYNEIYAYTLS